MTQPTTIIESDVLAGLATLPDGCVQCCVTSPPYWNLRDYGVAGQIGLESTPDEYVAKMVAVFGAVRRVLRDDGVLFLNLGDSYAAAQQGCDGLKPKDLCMIPWRVALALQADGWWLRSVIVWAKKSPMPESVTDRPTSSWEPIFLLAKSDRYYYDAVAVQEHCGTSPHARGGVWTPASTSGPMDRNGSYQYDHAQQSRVWGGTTRNQRNVWHLGPEPYREAHFATYPSEIPRRAILAGTSERGCCTRCRAPWERVVDRTAMVIEPSGRDGRIPGNGQRSTSGAMVEPPSSRTLGWRPTCSCDAGEPVPCLVLDPFLGSGTTLAVAAQLGRHGVGCELNPAYAALARDRIGKSANPSTYRADRVGEAGLWEGVTCG